MIVHALTGWPAFAGHDNQWAVNKGLTSRHAQNPRSKNANFAAPPQIRN